MYLYFTSNTQLFANGGHTVLQLGTHKTHARPALRHKMNVKRHTLAVRAAVRQLVQRNLSSAAAVESPVRFQQVEWRRAWTAEEQAQQAKHAALQKALQKAQAKDSAFMAKVCEDLVAAAGTNWKLEMTTTAHEHRFGQEVAK